MNGLDSSRSMPTARVRSYVVSGMVGAALAGVAAAAASPNLDFSLSVGTEDRLMSVRMTSGAHRAGDLIPAHEVVRGH